MEILKLQPSEFLFPSQCIVLYVLVKPSWPKIHSYNLGSLSFKMLFELCMPVVRDPGMFSKTVLIFFQLTSRSWLYFNRFSPSSDLVVTNIFFNLYLNCLLTLFSVSYHGEMFDFYGQMYSSFLSWLQNFIVLQKAFSTARPLNSFSVFF